MFYALLKIRENDKLRNLDLFNTFNVYIHTHKIRMRIQLKLHYSAPLGQMVAVHHNFPGIRTLFLLSILVYLATPWTGITA
jgi:hypothetical protein